MVCLAAGSGGRSSTLPDVVHGRFAVRTVGSENGIAALIAVWATRAVAPTPGDFRAAARA